MNTTMNGSRRAIRCSRLCDFIPGKLRKPILGKGACYYSVEHTKPSRLDFYRARVVDGLGRIVHERLFVLELADGEAPALREPSVLGDFQSAPIPANLPPIASTSAGLDFLNAGPMSDFLAEVQAERIAELEQSGQAHRGLTH